MKTDNNHFYNRIARELVHTHGQVKARKVALKMFLEDGLTIQDYVYLLNKIDHFSTDKKLIELNANDLYLILAALYTTRAKDTATDIESLIHHIEQALEFALGGHINED